MVISKHMKIQNIFHQYFFSKFDVIYLLNYRIINIKVIKNASNRVSDKLICCFTGLIILEVFSLVGRKMYDTKKMQFLWFVFDWKFLTSAINNRLKLNVPPAWILSFYNNNQFLAKIVTFSMLKRLQKYKISCKMNVGVFIYGLFTAIHSLHFIFRG